MLFLVKLKHIQSCIFEQKVVHVYAALYFQAKINSALSLGKNSLKKEHIDMLSFFDKICDWYLCLKIFFVCVLRIFCLFLLVNSFRNVYHKYLTAFRIV